MFSSTEIDDMIRKSTNLLLTRTLSHCLQYAIKKKNVGLAEVRFFFCFSSICVCDYLHTSMLFFIDVRFNPTSTVSLCLDHWKTVLVQHYNIIIL